MSDGNRAPVSDRGEASLVFDGTVMGLRPSFEALDAIEKTLGRGLVDLAGAAIRKELSMSETGQIACELSFTATDLYLHDCTDGGIDTKATTTLDRGGFGERQGDTDGQPSRARASGSRSATTSIGTK